MILGAILAGGRASRFGTDKAHALLHGRRLIDHVAAALARDCAAVIVCGRDEPGFDCIDDTLPGRGPLGGLAAALAEAERRGFDLVLTAPCDTPLLPPGLARHLEPAPAYLVDCPVIGLWPTGVRAALEAHLGEPGTGAMRRFAGMIAAAPRAPDLHVPNVNRPDDLAMLGAGG